MRQGKENFGCSAHLKTGRLLTLPIMVSSRSGRPEAATTTTRKRFNEAAPYPFALRRRLSGCSGRNLTAPPRTPDAGSSASRRTVLAPDHVAAERRDRRHPRRTQFDYLHLRRLLVDLEHGFRSLPEPTRDVLDIFCGARPYDDLLPRGSRCVGLDIDEKYGTADVVSREFLPFDDASFDLVMCTQAFYYVEDPQHGVAEIRRVLRSGGTALIATPLVWEYNPNILEHRYTGPELADLFAGWDDVRVVENGGRGVSWALLTGRIVESKEAALPPRMQRALSRLFGAGYLAVNMIGALIESHDEHRGRGAATLPANLLLTARRPRNG
jgi:SAM-dependent methyltransferase